MRNVIANAKGACYELCVVVAISLVLGVFLSACSGEGGNFTNPSDDEPTNLSRAEGQGSSSSKTNGSGNSSGVTLSGASAESNRSSSSEQDAESGSSENFPVSSSDSADDVESSSGSELFDWSLPKEAYLNPEIQYDSIVDERDGQVYKTVQIGNWTWMAQNLNFDPGPGGSGDSTYEWSWCYDNDPKKCDVGGRLYTWAAAMDSISFDDGNGHTCGYVKLCVLTPYVQGICPEGWLLPTRADWKRLLAFVYRQSSAEGKALKSQTGWYDGGNGTNEFGFSVIPVGFYRHTGFTIEGFTAHFWSNMHDGFGDNDDPFDAYVVGLGYDDDYVEVERADKNLGFSVRCLKDLR
jgi:uncharacterized protein (TIGR02145 family)